MKSFTIVFQLDETGWWFTRIKELQGCHTQAKTLKQARERIEEALDLFIEEDEKYRISEEFDLPEDILTAIDEYVEAQRIIEQQQAELQNLRKQAVGFLHQLQISTRDTGQLMGLSHQRVSQILREKESSEV